VDSYEHGNEPFSSTKGRELFDQLSDSQLLKGSAPWCYIIFKPLAD